MPSQAPAFLHFFVANWRRLFGFSMITSLAPKARRPERKSLRGWRIHRFVMSAIRATLPPIPRRCAAPTSLGIRASRIADPSAHGSAPPANRHLASSNPHLSNRFINRYFPGSLSFSTSVDAKGLSRFVPPMRNWKLFTPNYFPGSFNYYIRASLPFCAPDGPPFSPMSLD